MGGLVWRVVLIMTSAATGHLEVAKSAGAWPQERCEVLAAAERESKAADARWLWVTAVCAPEKEGG